MSSIDDLKSGKLAISSLLINKNIVIIYFEVLEDSLEKRGTLNQIKAKIRSEIFSSLEDNNDQIPKLPHENLLINELIREYLEFNDYKFTNSVFMKGYLFYLVLLIFIISSKTIFLLETGQPTHLLSKDLVITELGLKDTQVSKQM